MEIIEHQTLEMSNVLSCRARLTQLELGEKAKEIEDVLQRAAVRRKGPIVTTTYGIEQGPQGPIMDIELLIPLEDGVAPPADYILKPRFLLTNAIMLRHVGNPSGLQNSVNELNAYIAARGLVPITSGYNVTVKDAKTPLEMDDMEIHVYVGISPNLL